MPLLAIWLIALSSTWGCVPGEPQTLTPEVEAKLDSELREAVVTAPDSMVGVLVRTRTRPDPDQRAQLEAAGLAVGAVVGDVVSGRIIARDVPVLAGLEFVLRIQHARPVPEPRPPGDAASAGDPAARARPWKRNAH